MKKIDEIIKNTNDDNVDTVNWTNAWSKKYPVLAKYSKEVNIKKYSEKIRNLLEELKTEYNYSELDSMLILKDMLYHEWKDKK